MFHRFAGSFQVSRRSVERTEFSRKDSAGAALAVLGLLVFYFSVFSLQLERTPFLDLAPDPDASEYLAGAVSLHKGFGYRIQLAGELHPPRYPFGYSVSMLPLLWLGVEPVLAPFWVNRVAALALLLQVFFILRAFGGPLAAGLGVLLTATLPAYIILARSPLSEMTATCLVFAGFFLYFSAYRKASGLRFWLCGLLVGISCCFRLSHFFFLPALGIGLFSQGLRDSGRRIREGGSLTTGFLVGVSPLLIFHLQAFGSPFSSGYSYWVPYWSNFSTAFQLAHLPGQLAYFWGEMTQRQDVVTTAEFYGLGSYFGPALALLALPAGYHFLRKVELRPLAVAAAAFSATCLFYFHPDGRLLFPILVLAATGIAAWASQRLRSSGWALRIVIVGLLLFHSTIFPGHRLDPDLERYLRRTRWHGAAHQHDMLIHLREFTAGLPFLAIVDINPARVFALTEGPRIVSPLPPRHDYRFNPSVFQFGSAELADQIGSALDREWTVLLALRQTRVDQIPQLPPGYEWKSFYSNAAGGSLSQAVFLGREPGAAGFQPAIRGMAGRIPVLRKDR